MKYGIKEKLIFSLLIVAYLLFTYYVFDGWWYSSIGSLIIVRLSYLIWGKDFLEYTGLQINTLTIIKALILASVIALCAFLLMRYIADSSSIVIEYTNWRDYYHDIFYILNEELVLGAIILFSMVKDWKLRPLTASLLLAVFFSLIHFVFYRWIFLDGGVIGLATLTTLFLVGFVRNGLIILSGHIAYSWALHFGWMIIMFGSAHSYIATEEAVTQPDRFNLYLGSTEILILSAILASAFGAFWYYKSRKRSLNKKSQSFD